MNKREIGLHKVIVTPHTMSIHYSTRSIHESLLLLLLFIFINYSLVATTKMRADTSGETYWYAPGVSSISVRIILTAP